MADRVILRVGLGEFTREEHQAVIAEAHDEWAVWDRRYLSDGSMNKLYDQPDPGDLAPRTPRREDRILTNLTDQAEHHGCNIELHHSQGRDRSFGALGYVWKSRTVPKARVGRPAKAASGLSLVALAWLGGIAPSTRFAAGPARGLYVALGDSYTSGPAIPVQQQDPAGCSRSDHNYPHRVAAALKLKLRDASCSGATTADMASTQYVPGGANSPQFDRLTRNTKLVTFGIGGNDIAFLDILQACLSRTPTGHPCEDHFLVNGDDQIRDRIEMAAPDVAEAIQGIHQRSPSARVLVVGYLDLLPLHGKGCWARVPFASGDLRYLRAKEVELNKMLATEASANQAGFVDAYAASIGHDACQRAGLRWVEPFAAPAAAPLHPNAAGMAGIATAVLKHR